MARDVIGRGQHVDISMHAACNVTTEMGSYGWLVAEETVLRQTGRHAMTTISMPTQMQCADGRYVTTGFPPRSQRDFEALVDWLETLGYRDEFPETMLLDLGVERGGVSIAEMATDDLAREIFGAGREALCYIAERIPARDFFVGGQTRGLACGVVASPEEAFESEHFVARGFQVEVEHDDLARGEVPRRAVPDAGVAVAHLGSRAAHRRARRRDPHRAVSRSSMRWFSAAWSTTCT